MSSHLASEAAELLAAARVLFSDDPAALRVLTDLDRRLVEPLRVALAGIVKAGKSTLLNALLGERIAPTDAGECTRVVTWYRHAASPSITLHLVGGATRRLPVRRREGALVLDLGETAAQDVDRIEIGWPSDVLRSMTLIDTPGIESLSQQVSARSAAFLVPEDAPSSADAIVYLMRHLHPKDLGFLEAFRDTAAGPSRTVNAIAVLSRADEIGSGRIDSLLSAGKVAARYERVGSLQSLVLGVLPVAGLLAEGARTLRESEFAAFRLLAAMERGERERLLLSSDRFVRPSPAVAVDEKARTDLLTNFGIYGVRLGTSLVRLGVADSTELAEGMIQHSGLTQLRRFVELNFVARASALKIRAVTEGVSWLLRDRPDDEASAPARATLERLQASSHGLKELALLSQLRLGTLDGHDLDLASARRIVGGEGLSAAARLGLAEDADDQLLEDALGRDIDLWRAASNDPVTDHARREVCRVMIRSLEQVASEIRQPGAGAAAPDVVPAGSPGQGGPKGPGQQRQQDEPALADEQSA